MTKDSIVLDVECEVVSVEQTALAKPSPLARVDAPHHAEKLRVIELIPIDYIWVEEKQGFYPVYGSLYGDGERPVMVNQSEREKRMTPPRKLLR